jgi:hypothetical protein
MSDLDLTLPDMMTALVTAGLFVLVSNQQTYDMVNGLIVSVLPDMPIVDDDGQPNMLGHVLHGLVLALLLHVLRPLVEKMQ